MKKEFKITEEEIRQIHAVLHDGNTPIFDKQSFEKMFPEAFKEDKKELPKYFTGWLKSSNTEDEQWLGYSVEGTVKYGIDSNGYWFCGNDAKIECGDYEASEQEVTEALTKEAVKRGYKNGNHRCLDSSITEKNVADMYEFKEGLLWYGNIASANCVFKNGKWAEVSETIAKEQAEKELIERKDWNEFRNTGLFLLLNQFLHIFGWALVVNIENNVVTECYPARVKFRGFDEKSSSEAYVKISKYMSEKGKELENEVSE